MTKKQPPRDISHEPHGPKMARAIRDGQWALLEKAATHDPLIWCWWDKAGRYRNGVPANVHLTGLIGSMEDLAWFKRHPDWLVIGEWDDAVYGAPIRITDAGRAALANRALYDMEPVEGGMVEPGWICTPSAPVVAA